MVLVYKNRVNLLIFHIYRVQSTEVNISILSELFLPFVTRAAFITRLAKGAKNVSFSKISTKGGLHMESPRSIQSASCQKDTCAIYQVVVEIDKLGKFMYFWGESGFDITRIGRNSVQRVILQMHSANFG